MKIKRLKEAAIEIIFFFKSIQNYISKGSNEDWSYNHTKSVSFLSDAYYNSYSLLIYNKKLIITLILIFAFKRIL